MSGLRLPRPAIIAVLIATLAAAAGLWTAFRPGSALRARAAGERPGIPEVESPLDLMAAAGGLRLRSGADTPGAYAAAARTRARLARTVAAPGGGGTWEAVGHGPLVASDPAFPATKDEGYVNLAGRISDLQYDADHSRVLAAVASGGVWQSGDGGQTWQSIGDNLPTQSVGSVTSTPAGGGTIVALTGDNSFGAYSSAGLGAYFTRDDGRTWTKSTGVPDGALGFKLAVDPTDPSVVYAATGFGLYRSADAGASFTNVDLPTGTCHGDSSRAGCFLANVVTDVVVQAPDHFGHAGGAVLAVVGWRAGTRKNFDGVPQAPANGLYRSDTGAPGTFQGIDEDAAGFMPQAAVGRVELGAATGPEQDHGYVYALVQDSQLFDKGTVEGLDLGDVDGDPLDLGIDPLKTATYLGGVYVSSDFGRHWTLMADRHMFELPTTGSALAATAALGQYGPGIQSWYDQWIEPDPTRQSGGVPTRVGLGLEELYENLDTTLPQNRLGLFTTIGPYISGGGSCFITLTAPLCTASRRPGDTTTHPDQHAGLWVPDGQGGVTLIVGNDGGVYTQHLDSGQDPTPRGFGTGNQTGFNTLLPYGVTIASDGTVFAGLQDNGELRIDGATGAENSVYGGDGIFTVVSPKDPRYVWEETQYAGANVSTDGGHVWKSAAPGITSQNASFYTPLLMDPLNPDHLVTGGRQVIETTDGARTPDGYTDASDVSSSTRGWINVFDLGTREHPGRAPDFSVLSGKPLIAKGDVQNQISAEAVRGDAVYAGFCASCDPVRDHVSFTDGIATNVGGSKPARARTSDGWHIARAEGLPHRMMTSITIDPQDSSTIYVTLGSSSLRPYVPPGGVGSDGTSAQGGFVYQSTDAGQTFHDITGNLPRIGASWTVLHGRQLVVATFAGVFASTRPVPAAGTGLRYGPLGKSLPTAPVFSLAVKPDDPETLVAATFGRGVYRYHFTGTGCRDRTAPTSRVDVTRSRLTRHSLRLRGTALDRGCLAGTTRASRAGRVRRVQVSLARRVGARCSYLTARGTLTSPRSCRRPVYLRARGTRHWSLSLARRLPPGAYRVVVRARDSRGNVERRPRARRLRVR